MNWPVTSNLLKENIGEEESMMDNMHSFVTIRLSTGLSLSLSHTPKKPLFSLFLSKFKNFPPIFKVLRRYTSK
jgi:hypothetical protein